MVLWCTLVECRDEKRVVCSQPSWIDVKSLRLSVWSSPSTVPMTATCHWMIGLGSKFCPEDQCRWWSIYLSTKLRLEELVLWRSNRVADAVPRACTVLLDVVERLIEE